jgi:hypothetical protein
MRMNSSKAHSSNPAEPVNRRDFLYAAGSALAFGSMPVRGLLRQVSSGTPAQSEAAPELQFPYFP